MFPILALTTASFVQPVVEPSVPKVDSCLSTHEMREAIEERRAVQPLVAFKAAGGGERIRAQLCKSEAGLVYLITTLGPNGHVSRIIVDAISGQRVGTR